MGTASLTMRATPQLIISVTSAHHFLYNNVLGDIIMSIMEI
jgi:hypothetical protein